MRARHAALALALLTASGCGDEHLAPLDDARPTLFVRGEDAPLIRERLSREPYATVHAKLVERAAREREAPHATVWDHDAIGRNMETAQASATLAWLHDDQAAADKARALLLALPTNFDSNDTWDVNIRMPRVLMPACAAYDMLAGTPWLPQADAQRIAERITGVTAQFFERYLENPVTRQLVLGFSQNNHPIRTATAIGTVAITFADHPSAARWANWAVSELDYLLGPKGRYLQPDGGVSEGPFYYGFAYAPAVAFLIAMERAVDPERRFVRDCRNRQDVEPWIGHGCLEGEPFRFDNPLYQQRFHATVDWSIAMRLPSGWRAPLADGNMVPLNGGALLSSFGGGGHTRWDWENSGDAELPLTSGLDLIGQHLFDFDDTVAAEEPPWRNRFLLDAGAAVFRSDWGEDARWLMLVAERGHARRTLHDHVDGTSFTLAAYGDYLLVDPGRQPQRRADRWPGRTRQGAARRLRRHRCTADPHSRR
jgi:hypothetical protein